MNNLSILAALIIGCLLSTFSYGQHTECQDAFIICQFQDYHFTFSEENKIKDDVFVPTSSIKETNPIWLQFTCRNSGSVEFNIVPDDPENDIDFIVYESQTNNTCATKKAIRVMTSGMIIGVENSKKCIGQTGLRQVSGDSSEQDGCYNSDDNFLKPLDITPNRTYFIFINNYDSKKGFTILFNDIDESLTIDQNCEENSTDKIDFALFPNPSTNAINITSNKVLNKPIDLQIFDPTGQLFLDKNIYEPNFDKHSLSIKDYPPGKYFIRIIHKGKVSLKSFVKQ